MAAVHCCQSEMSSKDIDPRHLGIAAQSKDSRTLRLHSSIPGNLPQKAQDYHRQDPAHVAGPAGVLLSGWLCTKPMGLLFDELLILGLAAVIDKSPEEQARHNEEDQHGAGRLVLRLPLATSYKWLIECIARRLPRRAAGLTSSRNNVR